MGSKRAPLFVGIAVVLVAILVVLFLVLPKMGEVAEAKDDLRGAEARGVALQARREALEGAQEDAPENEATIAAVRSQIPEVPDEPGLLLLLDNAATSAGLAASQFTLAEPVFDDVTGLSVIGVSVTAEGTYFQIADFLYNLETLPRATKVLTADMAPGEETSFGSPTLTITATLQAYSSDADPALPGSQEGPSAGGGSDGGEEG